MIKLVEHQQLPTSGARCIELFEINGEQFLAIPQLAEDIPGDPPNMNGGNSDVDVIIYRWEDSEFVEHQRIPSHGNEHVSFYDVGGRYFLAVASIRSGRQPDFNMNVSSALYEWKDNGFVAFQSFDTFAAKSCQFFKIDNTHFLGFSEGVKEPGAEREGESYSHLYRWSGEHFEPFQSLPSTWGYDMSFFQFDSRSFLAIADNLATSVIYEWNGTQFTPFQEIAKEGGGRHFCFFTVAEQHYIAFANLLHDSELYQWNGAQFDLIQTISGAGGRSFCALHHNQSCYLFQTNFITGPREQPITTMDSVIYEFHDNKLKPVSTYPTSGGTETAAFTINNRTFVVVSNSLSKEVRFSIPSMVYELSEG